MDIRSHLGQPPYLANLTLWYAWHKRRSTLPAELTDADLAAVSRAAGSPLWQPIRPWRVELPGIEVHVTETDGERAVEWGTPRGTLTSRWELGPDGDWWQTAYPATTGETLPALRDVIEAMQYAVEPVVAPQGTLAVLELPRRPYSDLLHDYLGWSEGLMLLYEHPDDIAELLVTLQLKLDGLVAQITAMDGPLVYSPDNLDGQFISPRAFDQHLAASYAATADALHAADKALWVHIGGPASRLLPKLAEAGVDGLEGICAAPQGDTTLRKARELVGPNVWLWGGIPQDALLTTHDWAAFEQTIQAAADETAGDDRAILGIADRVPVDADWSRLQAIPELISAWKKEA